MFRRVTEDISFAFNAITRRPLHHYVGMLENFRLRVFRAVAEHLSFRRAGEELYLSQPAVTLQIKALEEELGTAVFHRGARGVSLSAAGEILLRYARRLHTLSEEAEQALADARGELSGDLVIGASTTIAQYVLPRHLAAFGRRFPAIRLQMFSQNTDRIIEGVAQGEYMLGFAEGPARRQDVKLEPWFEDELLLVVPNSHEWAELGAIDAWKLAGEPLVMRERGSGSRQVVELGLQRAGLRLNKLRIVMELDSTEAILSCVEAGLGLGIVSEWAVQRRQGARTLASLRLTAHPIKRLFAFVLPRNPVIPDQVSTLIQFLEQARAGSVRGDKNT
jgi:DNA-binding transcriptional LysR family regulator